MAYSKTNWENLPSINTPLNQTNLNKIENELEKLDKLSIYSTEEVKIGTWIDGKPLYRIVASINLQNYTSWTNLVHISNLKRVINIYGSLNNIIIPRYESPSYFTQFLYENNYIKVMCNGNTGGGYLVIEYTKTTD